MIFTKIGNHRLSNLKKTFKAYIDMVVEDIIQLHTSFWMVSFTFSLLEWGSVHTNPASTRRT